MAERKSRYTLAGRIRSKHAKGVTAVTTRLLKPHKDKCHTITLDNGKKFKVLGYRTPHEILFGVEIRYTKKPLAVALQT